MAGVIAAGLVALSGPFVRGRGAGGVILPLAATLLPLAALASVIEASVMARAGVLRASGRARWVTSAHTMATWLVMIPLALVGVLAGGGVLAAWGARVVALVALAIGYSGHSPEPEVVRSEAPKRPVVDYVVANPQSRR